MEIVELAREMWRTWKLSQREKIQVLNRDRTQLVVGQPISGSWASSKAKDVFSRTER